MFGCKKTIILQWLALERTQHLLVAGFKHVFSIIYGIILPIDFHMFQYG